MCLEVMTCRWEASFLLFHSLNSLARAMKSQNSNEALTYLGPAKILTPQDGLPLLFRLWDLGTFGSGLELSCGW